MKKMKKGLALLLAMSLTAGLAGCGPKEQSETTPVTATATAKGFGGDVTVTLEITDGVLTNVQVTGENETPAVGGQAMEQLPEAMKKSNSVVVDAIAGATITSNAILEAAAQALKDSGKTLTPVEGEDAAGKTLPDETVDVLVIGGGGAGLTAAISACEEGASVILVEKLAFLGGCAAMSGGVMTRAAQEGDEEPAMSGEDLYDFLMETAENRADPDILSTYIDSSVDTYNWIYDNMVPNPQDTYRFPMIPESIVSPRLPDGGGELMGHIQAYAEKMDIDIRLQTTATELVVDGDTVVGAKVRTADGSEQTIYAKGGVVLATGGFASSPEKLAQYSTPGADKIASYASAGVVGGGLDMAEAVNAKITFNDDWDTCGGMTLATSFYYDPDPTHYMVAINDQGQRFVNEANIQPTIYTAMRRQMAEGVEGFWYLADDNVPDIQWFVDNTEAQIAQSIEELSTITGISVETLTKTIEDYNAAAGTDNDVLGKPADYNKGLTAPYVVMDSSPLRTNTIGGLSITTDAQVYDVDGNTIPGLYAAGELANANFFGTIYTCGTALGHAFVYGRIAGQNAAARAK